MLFSSFLWLFCCIVSSLFALAYCQFLPGMHVFSCLPKRIVTGVRIVEPTVEAFRILSIDVGLLSVDFDLGLIAIIGRDLLSVERHVRHEYKTLDRTFVQLRESIVRRPEEEIQSDSRMTQAPHQNISFPVSVDSTSLDLEETVSESKKTDLATESVSRPMFVISSSLSLCVCIFICLLFFMFLFDF